MSGLRIRYTPEKLALRALEVFDENVRPMLQPADDGKFVAIDVDSGAYVADVDDYSAVTRLRTSNPNAEIWLGRVGDIAAYRLGRSFK